MRAILEGDYRSAEDKERDAARHPLETLMFFGIHERMHVVEIWPFFGWYSKIIAPLVKDEGRYMAAIFPPDNKQDYMNQQRQDYIDLLNTTPEVYGTPHIGDFGNGYFNYAPDNSADLIITIRNLHNWLWDADYSGNKRPPYYKEVFDSFMRILKPGGILGVEQHRGDPTKPQDPFAKKLYVRQDYAINLLEEAGFVLLSKTGAELLFELISQRYERSSTLITSNLPFEEWTETFGSERLTGALLDRLTHHVSILEMNGESYRLGQSRKETKKH